MFQYDLDFNYADFNKFFRWIELWKKILSNWKNVYFQIKELNDYFTNNQNVEVSFSKNQFFGSGKYAWPYSLSNAKLIIEKAKYHTNLYELLLYHPFDNALSLHKTHESLSKINSDYDESSFLKFKISNSIFAKSKKDRKQYFNSLKIGNWTYSEVIISAICYCLQHIFIENTEKLPKTIYWQKAEFPEQMQKESLIFNLERFFYSIFDYLVYFQPHQLLVEVFTEINLISVYKLQFIKAFQQKFQEIKNKDLHAKNLNGKKINKTALFYIFKAFNLPIIFPDYLITNVVTWSCDRNIFVGIINMLDVNQYFLEKLDLFPSTYLNSSNFEKNIEEIEKIFIINFFQLETIDGIGIKEEYGNLENQNFIELVKFFHTLFPSFSLGKIYAITENQYLFLKRQEKSVERERKRKMFFQNLPFKRIFIFFCSLIGGFLSLTRISSGAVLPAESQLARSIASREAFTASSSQLPTPTTFATSASNLQKTNHTKKTLSGQLHLSISASSRFQNLAQKQPGVWLVEVLPRTESEFYLKQGQTEKFIIVHGAGGTYDHLTKDQKDLINYAKSINAKIMDLNDLVKAHLAPANLRKNCGIRTDVGRSFLASKLWNKTEEFIDPECRMIPYSPAMQNVTIQDILIDQHERVREAMVEKLEEQAKLSCNELLLHEQTIAGHKENSYMSVKQLCRDSESLRVKPEEGIHVLYARATISQMRDLHALHSSPVQEAMFHNRGFSTSQNPRKQVKPGVTLDETRAALDRKYIIGMGICENISSAPEAKKILQNGLAHEHYEGYANVQQASQRYKYLQNKQKQGEVTDLPSFNSQQGTTLSPKPGTTEYYQYIEQSRVAGLNQPPLDPAKALKMSRDEGIHNFNKSDKHPIRSVTGRPNDEVFENKFREN